MRRLPILVATSLLILSYLSLLNHDPYKMDLDRRFAPPSLSNPLGTDQYGRDIAARLLRGVFNSFSIAALSVSLAAVLGSLSGMLSGYAGKKLGEALTRVSDAVSSFPPLLLAILFSSVTSGGFWEVTWVLSFIYFPRFFRVSRAVAIRESKKLYVEAAVAIGSSRFKVVSSHILPNALPAITAETVAALSGAIIIESKLSFLGLGVSQPIPTLGNMVSEGISYIQVAPWLTIAPGMALIALVLAINISLRILGEAPKPRWLL